MKSQEFPTRFPVFFIVGAPKCGTTTLYKWLITHPDVHAPRKEPGFFSRDIADNTHVSSHIRSLDEYVRLLGTSFESGKIGGEATPKYLYSDNALREISRLQPNARIVVCLRDPVELVISLHNQKLREGVEDERSFEKAWAASLAATDGTGPSVPHERNYYLWACIGSRLQKLYEHFPADSIKILLAPELRADPHGCYLQVLSHLGLSDDGRSDFSSYNERVAIRSLAIHRSAIALKRLTNPVLGPLYRLRKGKGFGFLKLINRFNTERGRYTAAVSEEFKQGMYEMLAEEIALAESYLNGRDLLGRMRADN